MTGTDPGRPPFTPDSELLAPYLDPSAGRLLLQRCRACGTWRFPPRRVCAACGGRVATWEAASGRGTVWSYAVFHKSYLQEFDDLVPYNVAIVELAEGPRVVSNVVGTGNDALRVGMAVEAVPGTAPRGEPVVQFRALEPGEGSATDLPAGAG